MAITAAMNEWGLVGYETLAARGIPPLLII